MHICKIIPRVLTFCSLSIMEQSSVDSQSFTSNSTEERLLKIMILGELFFYVTVRKTEQNVVDLAERIKMQTIPSGNWNSNGRHIA